MSALLDFQKNLLERYNIPLFGVFCEESSESSSDFDSESRAFMRLFESDRALGPGGTLKPAVIIGDHIDSNQHYVYSQVWPALCKASYGRTSANIAYPILLCVDNDSLYPDIGSTHICIDCLLGHESCDEGHSQRDSCTYRVFDETFHARFSALFDANNATFTVIYLLQNIVYIYI
jgi:hypothetical protein